MKVQSPTEIIRSIMKDVMPEGIEVESLFPDPVEEALDRPGALLDPETRRKLVGTQGASTRVDAYRELLSRQAALRDAYRAEIDKLLTKAEREGPKGRRSILKSFEDLARKNMTRARQHGLSVTTSSKALRSDSIMAENTSARASHDRLHFEDFLNAIWNGTEKMPREKRRNLYVDALDNMFHEGAVSGLDDSLVITWRLSPAEHCLDCIGLAAAGPYAKPGSERTDLDPLPTFPRRGDTDCLANCKCYLTYSRDDGKAVEPGQRTGSDVVDEETDEEVDSEEIDPETEEPTDRAAAAKEIDAARDEAQYAKAMYELTGDREWLKVMRDANGRIIDLQEEYGLKSIPRSESDLVATKTREAMSGGWEPVLKENSALFAEGEFASVLSNGVHYRGTIQKWNPKTGRGTFETLDGDLIEVGTAEDIPTIMFKRGGVPPLKGATAWSVKTPRGYDVSVEFAGKPAVYSEMIVEESSYNPVGSAQVIKRVLDKLDVEDYHGLNFKVGPSVTRSFGRPDTRKSFGRDGMVIEDDGIEFRGEIKDPTKGKAGLFGRRTVNEGIGGTIYKRHLSGDDLKAFKKIVDQIDEKFFIDKDKFLNDDGYMSAFGESYWRMKSASSKFKKAQPALFEFMSVFLNGVRS